MKRREDWFEGQLDLDPERLVFIDETWASTNMARRYGRAPRGQRLRMSIPHGHWKTTTFVGALRLTGMTAPMVLDGPINSRAFQAYVDQVLVPELKPGDVVLFQTGHLDKHFKPQPHAAGVWSDPLLGKSEGWPAPGPETIAYLKTKGIRCVATDAPDLGGVEPKRALFTYWALGSREMVGVEFLHHVEQAPAGSYFLFAPLKIRDCHGGPGRAIVLY